MQKELKQVLEREKWLISERLGYDCSLSAIGLCHLSNRLNTLMSEAFNKWLQELDH